MSGALSFAAAAGDDGYRSGQLLANRYRLVRRLAEGGTGVVWLATDLVLRADVAVKIVIPPKHDATGMFERRTADEARLCAQLTHPAICRVLDFGSTHLGHPFIASELLHGETLDDLLAREQRLPAVRAVQLLLPILEALEVAHDKGIVHRDVKPGNVFLAMESHGLQPKLLDFGIARSLHGTDCRVTTTGVVCGTPCYMSPEQARGCKDVDSRSDLWSFCVSLYEALAGTSAFFGENYNAIIWSILNTEPPALDTFTDTDAALARIVGRGLMKDREARWDSAETLRDELARWLLTQGIECDIRGVALDPRLIAVSDEPSATAPAGARTRRARATRLSVAVGLVIGALGAFMISERSHVALPANAASNAQAAATLLATEPLDREGALESSAAREAPNESDAAANPLPPLVVAVKTPATPERPHVRTASSTVTASERGRSLPATAAAVMRAPPKQAAPSAVTRKSASNALAYDFGL